MGVIAKQPDPDAVRSASSWTKDARGLLGILALGLVLRLFHLGGRGLWVDEAAYLRDATYALNDLLGQLCRHSENHPPLYFVLLHLQATISQSEWWIRLPSVAAGVLSVFLVYRVARTLTRHPATALLAAGFMATSAFQIRFCQEARMYALTVALGLISNYCFWLALRTKRGWPGFVLATAACAYTYYLTGFLWVAQIVTAVATRADRTFWRAWVLSQGILVALVFPLYWFYMRHLHLQDRSKLGAPDAAAPLLALLAQVSGLVWEVRKDVAATTLALAAVLSVLVLYLAARGASRLNSAAAWLLGANALVAPVALFLVSHTTRFHLFTVTYLCLFGPYAIILAARGLADSPRIFAIAIVLGWVLLNGVSLYRLDFDPTYETEDWRTVGAFLRREVEPGDLVIVQPSMYVLPVRYYYRGPLMPLDGDDGRVVEQCLPTAKRVWLCEIPFNWVVQQDPIERILDGRLRRTRVCQTVSTRPAAIIRVVRYEPRNASP